MIDYYKHKELKTWKEYVELAQTSRLEWIFRGQSNSNWNLQTTLERSNIVDYFPEFEKVLLSDFKKGVKFYLEKEELPQSTLEYYSMLQHFGAPSRLLDFTRSPYIASYFAFEQATEEAENVAIWVVDKSVIYQQAAYYLQKRIKSHFGRNNNTFNDQTFEEIIEESQKGDFNCIVPVEPENQNQRYHLQQSIFLAQGNPYISILDQLDFIRKDLLKKTFMKVTIPQGEKKNAIRDLIKMNINRATLFPGLDGYAKSLFLKYGNLPSFGETHEFLKYAQDKNMV